MTRSKDKTNSAPRSLAIAWSWYDILRKFFLSIASYLWLSQQLLMASQCLGHDKTNFVIKFSCKTTKIFNIKRVKRLFANSKIFFGHRCFKEEALLFDNNRQKLLLIIQPLKLSTWLVSPSSLNSPWYNIIIHSFLTHTGKP